MTLESIVDIVEMIQWRQQMEALDNKALAHALLSEAPLNGKLGALCDIVAERLSPGIIERLGSAAEDHPALERKETA